MALILRPLPQTVCRRRDLFFFWVTLGTLSFYGVHNRRNGVWSKEDTRKAASLSGTDLLSDGLQTQALRLAGRFHHHALVWDREGGLYGDHQALSRLPEFQLPLRNGGNLLLPLHKLFVFV